MDRTERRIDVTPTNPDECQQLGCKGPHEGKAEVVSHGDHQDFIVDGRLHHAHGDHCDDHGPVKIS
jgi:hypothetical protein